MLTVSPRIYHTCGSLKRHSARGWVPVSVVVSSGRMDECNTTATVERGRDDPTDYVEVRLAHPRDYGDIANVHCRAFYGNVSAFWDTLLRLDRVLALDQGDTMAKQGHSGDFCCLVCCRKHDSMPARDPTTTEQNTGISPAWILSRILDGALQKVQTKSSHSMHNYHNDDDHAIVGALCIDTNMAYIPIQRFTWPALFNGNIYSIAPRKKMAYISNLAVCTSQRRAGIGTKLVLAAEKLAAEEWGVTCSTLHVDPTNKAAYELYTRLGYRYVGRQDVLTAFFEGRRQDKRLVLMAKKLTQSQMDTTHTTRVP